MNDNEKIVDKIIKETGLIGFSSHEIEMADLNADLTFEVLKKDRAYYLNVIYCDKYSCDFIIFDGFRL